MNCYADDRPLAALHKLAILLAPCIDGFGLRLLRHVDGWPMHSTTAAYILRGRPIAAREELKRLGRWPGFWGCGTIVFNDEPSIGLLLHELAHALPPEPPMPDDIEPSQEQVEMQTAQLTTFVNRDRTVEPWAGHGADFIRRCLHLHWRAWQLGVEVGLPELMFAGEHYGLWPAWRYKVSLGDEPEQLAKCSFQTIDSLPAPPEFTELFEDDITKPRRQNDPPRKHIA